MKKLLILLLFIPLAPKAQDLTGITVNLTLRSGDWAFLVGHLQPGTDSVTLQRVRRLRDTVLVANPANYNTNVRFNTIPAPLVFRLYAIVKSLPQTLYERVGTNIDTQIKAIPNATLQSAITNFDADALGQYQYIRNLGKNILIDN